MLDPIIHWLRAIPGLENLTPERLEPQPGSAGLFCRGQQILRRIPHITGNEAQRRRLTLTLALHDTEGPLPRVLLELPQTAMATAPVLGRDQTLEISRAHLAKAGSGGIRRCEAQITFEYTSEV